MTPDPCSWLWPYVGAAGSFVVSALASLAFFRCLRLARDLRAQLAAVTHQTTTKENADNADHR